MKAITVTGPSGSGKTTVCEIIIEGLRRRGYTVGSVKEIHHPDFALDSDPKTNTGRHRTAGAQLITARAVYETDLLYQEKLPMDDILRHYDHDYVILEGVADCNVPRIITAHHSEEIEERLDGRTIAISGKIANKLEGELQSLPIYNALQNPETLVDLAENRAFEPLPMFEPKCCSHCGFSCQELTSLITQGQKKREDCLLFSQNTELFIDGQPLTLVPFVQNILKNAVLGVAKELDGFKQNAQIEVKLKI